ncbi:MAG TPA: hypothetical protein VFE17_00735 [Candidatus Baltobacteraceae bacterium]|jgi:hypothetical protein|nr:hypothetical protein [Candidatus Baltobacteraceae bacterium]
MNIVRLPLIACAIAIGFIAAAAPAAAAQAQSITHGGTYFGDVAVGSDQVVDGDITVYGGSADVQGRVNGDITTYGGTVQPEPGSVITGSINQYGSAWMSWIPWAPATSSMIAHEDSKLMVRLTYSVVVVLAFLLFPVRVRTALDRVEHHPGLSAAVGVLALVATVPVAVLLFISLVGWPLIPLEIVAIFAGILIGQAALGLLIGRRLYELMRPSATPSPLGALVLGLIVISAAEIVPFIGGLVTALVCLVGLGATVLAFIREAAFMGPTMGQTAPRPPIGGPPMTAA